MALNPYLCIRNKKHHKRNALNTQQNDKGSKQRWKEGCK